MPARLLGRIKSRARRAAGGGGGPVTDAIVTAINAEGWSVTATSPPTMEPATAPRFVSLSRQGFDASGAPATYPETLIMTQRVRQAFPNQASLDASRVALSDYVYSTDTVLGGQTNSSTETSPKPIARWALPDRATVGDSLRLEIVAAHRNGRNREMIAAVRFTATDGTNTVSATVAQSSILAHPGDRNPVVGYAATLDITSLTDGQITANAEVFPWIGGAASVLRSSDSTAGTRAFCPQIYRKGASRTVLYAYVDDATGTTTPASITVSSDPAVAAAGTPAKTLGLAIDRLRALDGGSITDGHVVRIKAGTQPAAIFAWPTATTHTGISELIVEGDPDAATGSVIATLNAAFNARHTAIRFRNLTINRTATTGQIGGGNQTDNFTLENVLWQNNSHNITVAQNNRSTLRWLGCRFTGLGNAPLAPGALVEHRLFRGCATDTTANLDPNAVLGCALTNATCNPAVSGYETPFVAFNRFLLQANGAVTFSTANGAAVIQNLVEFTSISTTAPAFRFSADGETGNITHLVCAYNSLTGFGIAGRGNILYADTPATNRTHKLCAFVGNIHASINVKTDIFASDGALVNAWAYMYGVGCRGEVAQFKDAGPAPAGGASHGSFQQAYPGLNASIGTSATVRNDPLFADYEGTVSASVAGSGGGAYTLQAGSLALGRVLNPVLRFDLYGGERPATNDAAGCGLRGGEEVKSVIAANLSSVQALRFNAGPPALLTYQNGRTGVLPSGWDRSGTVGIVMSAANPSPLYRYDTDGVPIYIRLPGAVVDECVVYNDGVSAPSNTASFIRLGGSNADNWANFRIVRCVFDGRGTATQDGLGNQAIFSSHVPATVPNNGYIGFCRSFGFPGDHIELNCIGSIIIENNYLGLNGFKQSASLLPVGPARSAAWPHFDGITLGDFGVSGANGPAIIRNNFFDHPYADGSLGRTNYIRRALGNVALPMEVRRNIFKGASDWGPEVPGDSEWTSLRRFFYPFGANNTALGTEIYDGNVIDRNAAYAYWNPGSSQPGTFTNNFDYLTGSPAVLP